MRPSTQFALKWVGDDLQWLNNNYLKLHEKLVKNTCNQSAISLVMVTAGLLVLVVSSIAAVACMNKVPRTRSVACHPGRNLDWILAWVATWCWNCILVWIRQPHMIHTWFALHCLCFQLDQWSQGGIQHERSVITDQKSAWANNGTCFSNCLYVIVCALRAFWSLQSLHYQQI